MSTIGTLKYRRYQAKSPQGTAIKRLMNEKLFWEKHHPDAGHYPDCRQNHAGVASCM